MPWMIFVLAALGAVNAPETAAANPCTNGSFEELAPGGFPVDWAPVGQTVEVSADAHSGKHSLRMSRTADAKLPETGLNRGYGRPGNPRGALLAELRGGVDFYYKAVSAEGAQLNVCVIPISQQGVENTGSPRATFTVPAQHVGDGKWHHARLKYDFSENPKARRVHFAARIFGRGGEMLLDDLSYVERVGPILRFGQARLEDDPGHPGRRCAFRVAVQNAGDEPVKAARVSIAAPPGVTADRPEIVLGDLPADETRRVAWILSGARDRAASIGLEAVADQIGAEASFPLAPNLEIRSFGPVSPVTVEGKPIAVECELFNPGNAIVREPKAEFRLAGDAVAVRAEEVLPGESVVLRTEFRPEEQTAGLPLAVRATAENTDGQLTALSTLVVGAATELPPPSGELRSVATDDCALLENGHLRLAFRRNAFGFGPGELLVRTPAGWQTAAWIPRLTRLIVRATAGKLHEQAIYTKRPPEVKQGDLAGLQFTWTARDADGAACHVGVTFTLERDARTIGVDSEVQCDGARDLLAFEGPMVYALDRDEAVFPGLEWLVEDEISSGTLDIAEGHPHQVRYVVHPNMVTIPAIGIHGRHGTVGLLWDIHQKWDGQRDRPSVAFASPDRFEGQRAHLVGLFLPTVPDFVEPNQRRAARPYPLAPGKPLRLSCRILADGEAKDPLAAVDAWIARFGLPEPAPLPLGSYEREFEFSMRAYLDSLWDPDTKDWWTTKGSAVMSKQGRPRMFVADLLLGEILCSSKKLRRACRDRAEEVLALIGGEPRVDAQRFPGRADLAMANPLRAIGLLSTRENDGSWRFDADHVGGGPFEGKDYHELGPDEAVEVGTCARMAYEVLHYARIAGDRDAYEAMVKTLELMERFRVPRAAQVWEVPVHTPDVLAAADAVDAYIEAFRFSGDERWLRDAIIWARRGLPFIYLWDDPQKPFLVGGSIPVFGATWFQGSWFGRPVQWNGLRYANALLKLAEHDRSYPWRRLAETIVRSAIHQQDREGENVALWPDNISAIDGQKCPWVFAPRQILRNVLKLTGRDEDPATVILGEGPGRLHVTSTGTVTGATWKGDVLSFDVTYPRGEQGVVLVSNVDRPAGVSVSGAETGPRDSIEIGAEPGWRYDGANGYLAIRIDRDGRSSVHVAGARFRRVQRIPQPADRIAFEFDRGTEGWTPAHDVAQIDVREGALVGRISGPDPYLVRTLMRLAGDEAPVIRVRMRVSAGGGGQLFWTTASSPAFAEDKTVRFPITADGEYHEYRLEPGNHPQWAGRKITALRIDPGNGARTGEFAVDYIRGAKE